MKLTMANPKTGKTYQKEIETTQERQFYGKKIGDTLSLADIGFAGYEGILTGGSDKQGVPMLKSVHGTARKRILLTKGTGLRKVKVKGVRIKKSVRGGKVSEDIQQLNIKITKTGSKKIESYFGENAEKTKEEEKAKATPKETPKKEEEKPVAEKKEVKNE